MKRLFWTILCRAVNDTNHSWTPDWYYSGIWPAVFSAGKSQQSDHMIMFLIQNVHGVEGLCTEGSVVICLWNRERTGRGGAERISSTVTQDFTHVKEWYCRTATNYLKSVKFYMSSAFELHKQGDFSKKVLIVSVLPHSNSVTLTQKMSSVIDYCTNLNLSS